MEGDHGGAGSLLQGDLDSQPALVVQALPWEGMLHLLLRVDNLETTWQATLCSRDSPALVVQGKPRCGHSALRSFPDGV